MKLYHLRHVDWLESQLIYHALPRLNMEGVLILAPRSPYVCIGYHQNMEQDVDVEYCQSNKIPIFRREVGGGAVYLDGNQIFFQIVLRKDHPLAKGSKADFYQRMLEPVAETYRGLGIPAQYRPVNDIVTSAGKKISGTGVAEIGDYIILVGNLIADFDYETMTRVLRVPDEKFRDKIYKSMTENLTTIKREIGLLPEWNKMADPLIRNFEKVLGKMESATLPPEVHALIKKITPDYLNDEWLFMKRSEKNKGNVKIASGVNIIQRAFKAPGGLLKATYELKDDVYHQVSLVGDFFCYPRDGILHLAAALEGTPVSDLESTIADFYHMHSIDTPGVTPADWISVLKG